METNQIQSNQLCVVTCMFPVDSDDEAVRIKKEIANILATIPESRIDFRLSSSHAHP